MRIFRSKAIRRVLSVVLLICMLILVDTIMGELLSPVTLANWFTHDVKEIEASGQDADLVFIGASRTLYTFVPQVFREKLNLTWVLNAASSSQPVCASYYQIKELVERICPKHVIIGVTSDGLRHLGNLQSRLIVYDRLKPINRLRMALDCIEPGEWPYLVASYRFKDNFSLVKMQEIAEEKAELIRTNFRDSEESPRHDYGYYFRYDSIATGNMPIKNSSGFSEEKLSQRNLDYLDACIELCKKHGIKVTLVSGLTSVSRMYKINNYQGAVDYYNRFAEQRGIKYYNLNFLRNREMLLPDEMMHDYNHANAEGAKIVSSLFAEILEKEANGEDVTSCFYENLDDFKEDVHRIVSVRAQIQADASNRNLYHISITSLQNEDVKAVYRVLLCRQGEDSFQVVQDWAPEKQMDLILEDEAGAKLRIEAGSTDETIGRAYQEYDLEADVQEGEELKDEES